MGSDSKEGKGGEKGVHGGREGGVEQNKRHRVTLHPNQAITICQFPEQPKSKLIRHPCRTQIHYQVSLSIWTTAYSH